jgi:hypothetical protein
MDAQTIFNTLIGLAGGLAAFLLKSTWDAIARQQNELQEFQTAVAANYVRRDDFKDHARRVEQLLDHIVAKLDAKVDKA